MSISKHLKKFKVILPVISLIVEILFYFYVFYILEFSTSSDSIFSSLYPALKKLAIWMIFHMPITFLPIVQELPGWIFLAVTILQNVFIVFLIGSLIDFIIKKMKLKKTL